MYKYKWLCRVCVCVCVCVWFSGHGKLISEAQTARRLHTAIWLAQTAAALCNFIFHSSVSVRELEITMDLRVL